MPRPDPDKFDNPFIISLLLNAILFKWQQKLTEWKTLEEMVQEIKTMPGLEQFTDVINDPGFSLKLNTLYEKYSTKQTSNMREFVDNLNNYLQETGSAIKYFNYFPDPPKSAMQFYVAEKNMNNEPVLDMEFDGGEKYRKMELDDLKRYYDELRALQVAERRRHSRVQCLYLNNRISATKSKLQLSEAENIGSGDSSLLTLPQAQPDKDNLPTASSSTNHQSTEISTGCAEIKLKAIDFYIICHPDMEKLEAFEKFSYLHQNERQIFQKLEEFQNAIYEKMMSIASNTETQRNQSVGEKRPRVN